MDDSQDKPDYFQYRWGVKEWDVGFTTIPNPVLKHYARVPWIDKDGKHGRGINNQEMLCIVHLASFHYESEEGESRPAIGTVARRMGYRKDDSVRGLIKSLEHKNLLMVQRRPGKCSIYDLLNFSRAILKMEGEQPPHPNGGLHSDGGLSNGGHSNGPHSQGDEEKKVLEERKQEGKEEKEKKEGFSTFPENGQAATAQEGGDGDDDQLGPESQAIQNGPDEEDLGASDQKPAGGALLRDEVRGQAGLSLPDGGRDHAAAGEKPDALRMDLARATASARAEAGGNYAAPPPAGGSFALGDQLITAACARLGRSEPEGKKRDHAHAFFGKALKSEGLLQGDEIMLIEAVKDWLDPEGEYAFFLSQYDLNPKHELALRHLGIVLSKAKRGADETPDRHDRYDTPNVRASQAAWKERQAARPPPAQDDEVGQAIKGELALQMTKATFETWVKPAGMACDDGVFVVTAPDETVRGWLENRLATTIRRTAVGVVGGAVEVRFEIAGGQNERTH
jgi:hypothetical protein